MSSALADFESVKLLLFYNNFTSLRFKIPKG